MDWKWPKHEKSAFKFKVLTRCIFTRKCEMCLLQGKKRQVWLIMDRCACVRVCVCELVWTTKWSLLAVWWSVTEQEHFHSKNTFISVEPKIHCCQRGENGWMKSTKKTSMGQSWFHVSLKLHIKFSGAPMKRDRTGRLFLKLHSFQWGKKSTWKREKWESKCIFWKALYSHIIPQRYK